MSSHWTVVQSGWHCFLLLNHGNRKEKQKSKIPESNKRVHKCLCNHKGREMGLKGKTDRGGREGRDEETLTVIVSKEQNVPSFPLYIFPKAFNCCFPTTHKRTSIFTHCYKRSKYIYIYVIYIYIYIYMYDRYS